MLGIFHTWLYMPCPKLLGGFGSVAFCFLTFVPTVILITHMIFCLA